jgi:hypothetical protein
VHFGALEFRDLHGHMPRGVALWVFYFDNEPDEPWIAGQKDNDLRPLTYMQAKQSATREAQRRHVTYVRVDQHPL